jgi:iron complex outermembrane recepter protein
MTSLNGRLGLTAAGALMAGLMSAAPAFSVGAEAGASAAAGDSMAAGAATGAEAATVASASGNPEPAAATERDEPGYSAEIVVTATRTARAIDHIPGSVVSIGGPDLENIQLASLDSNQVLAQAIPGYTASFDDLTTSGELLRGKRPQFFLDGVLISTPLRDIGRMSSAMVDPLLIDHIEVVNGASAIEGLGGSGGMINYITKTPKTEGVVNTVQTAMETQLKSNYIGWKAAGVTMVKKGPWDFLFALGTQSRPMYFDGREHLEYLNTNGSYMDSKADSITAKLGFDFGEDNSQRLQAYFNNYDLIGNNNYNSLQPGNRKLGIVQTSQRGPNPGPAFANHIREATASYINNAVFGGTVTVLGYLSKEALPNTGVIDNSKQDPRIAPIGTLIDASSVISNKSGVKAYWAKKDLFVEGFDLNFGYDFNEDDTSQYNRTWLPDLKFTANSGYVQGSYDLGPLTFSAGARYQSGKISVPSFQTLYQTAPKTNGVFFEGGTKDYNTSVYNGGIVYRLPAGWSTFVGISQGYDLPDIGTVIRNTSKPGQSINTVAEVDPIKTTSYEAGLNWRAEHASFGADAYYDTSPASTLVVLDPNTLLQTVSRNPQVRKGLEFSGEWKINRQFRVSGSYSRMTAYTSLSPGLPVNLHITPASTVGQDPDKAVLRADYTPTSYLSVDLVETHFWGMRINGQFPAANQWNTTEYNLMDGSISYKTESYGAVTLGCSNILNTFQIVNENGTNDTTYYAIQGRKYTVTYQISF